MHLPEHVHDAAEGLGHRRALATQRIELTLNHAVEPAKLAELAPEPLALLLARFERATQAVALLDQRRDRPRFRSGSSGVVPPRRERGVAG